MTRRHQRPITVRTLLALAAVAFATTGAIAAAQSDAPPKPDGKAGATAAKPSAALVERGRYIVATSGCNDCHTPWKMGEQGPEPDMSLMLSGHPASLKMPPPPKLPDGPWNSLTAATNTAFAGPWGVSYTANLTPHEETGLGLWTLANFRDTLRTGKHLGRGRDILPPMPWPVYGQLTDADIEAVYSYLRTIPAIDNQVPEPDPPAG
jgi:mono/diheme cytochrome c family protein